MEKIEINGKKYPFIVSAANAALNAQMAISESEELNLNEMVDQFTDILHMGLKDGQLMYPFFKRIFTKIPSKETLKHTLTLDEMVRLTSQAATPPQKEVKEEEVEKKP